MKDKILEKSSEMFLTFGFKSVTMDDIATKIGVSKKTLYKYYSNKTHLVDEVTNYVFETISKDIDEICRLESNPIVEIFSIKNLMMKHLKNEKSSPQHQLQKYYPKTFERLKKRQFEMIKECTYENIIKGKKLGLYREDIDIDFVIRIYFIGVTGIKDQNYFSLEKYSMKTLTNYFLEYHLRGICSKKGIKELENQLKQK